MRGVNEKLARLGVMPLSLAESMACRLFTGPMALKYDALLKYATHPTPAVKTVCDELCMNNGYQTTLTALIGALRRLARLADASTPLYRCVSPEAAAAVWRHQ